MGVQGLWELLAPVGRRVSVETLANKRLAIDASIWMVQFIKAMRDEKGDMVQNAHLIGFFRRICKLLFLRTKPIFVFDGATPALKRRTVIARRRQRENAQTKIRKTAEKLLLNRLKDMRLKEQAKDIKNQRLKQNDSDREKKRVSSDSVQDKLRDSAEQDDVGVSFSEKEKLDEISQASMVGENGVGDVVEESMKDDPKGKGVLLDGVDLDNKMKSNIEHDSSVQGKDYQEKLDEMLAASLVAEEEEQEQERNFTSKASTSAAAILSEEDDSDEDEEILLPVMDGNVDPAVLASLPPSMQLDLLGQMREKLMAENRQKYQKVKKAPEKFSELQIEAYLKTVAFRREINEVQRSAGGRAVGGVQTSRIASEANREFIFSSSFAGDKEVLVSAREGRNDENQKKTSRQSLPVPVKKASSLNKSDATIELDRDEPTNPDENIEIYKDERGRFRIRNRHMGIQMTRDIQRNLHLMKEKERTGSGSMAYNDETFGAWENFPTEDQFLENSPVEKDDVMNLEIPNDDSMVQNPSSIEISFDHDGGGKDLNDEDDMFLQLAAGGPVTISSTENDPKEDSSPWASDSDWEEVPIEQNTSATKLEVNSSNQLTPKDISNDEGAAREENSFELANNSTENDTVTKFTKGYLEEEADLQEAIKKSLLELYDKDSEVILLEENQSARVNHVDKPCQDSLCFRETVGDAEQEGFLDEITDLKTSGSINELSNTFVADNLDGQKGITKQFGTHSSSGSNKFSRDVRNELPKVESVISPEKAFNVASQSRMLSTMAKQHNEEGSESFGGESVKVSAMPIADEERTGFLGDTAICGGVEKGNVDGDSSIMMDDTGDYSRRKFQSPVTKFGDPSRDVIRSQIGILHDIDSHNENKQENHSNEHTFNIDSSIDLEGKGVPVEFSEANIEKEIRVLDQEFVSLGDEQRKLERNAESVSSEMFADCQELLQIFGIPYIIAPMEAEAQCAFMEQLDLVDGIVTDDSDVFLFGARSVYKNIFDDRKYVETYFMKDIEKELGLSRDKIIRMAMLLGSDYTEGISGIGIVNAIEVVTAFPEEDGLQKFREWVESPDPTILGKTDAKTGSKVKKRGSGSVDNKGITAGASTDDTEEIKQIFMDKHRKVSKNWNIPTTFPSEAVISAYLNPQVDRSTEIFSWGKPDLSVLRKLCWEKFGWNGKKTDDLLLPVLKEYEKRETQLRIEAFYSFNERFAKIRSKRINKAVKGIGGGLSSEGADHTLQEGPRKRNKKRVAPQETKDNNTSDKDSPKANEKVKNKRKCVEKPCTSRGRGRAQKRGRGRGRVQKDLFELSDGTSDDDDKVVELPAEPGNLQKMRRSTRSRNPVKYNAKEDDEVDESRSHGESPKENLEDDDEGRVGNVSAERTQNETTIDDASINNCPSEDYIETGGGFCVDEADETGDAHLEDKPTDDYRVIGGGFCVDEDEDETAEEDAEMLYMENEEVQKKGKRRNEEDNASSLEKNVEIDFGNSSVGGLSAMPFLKRKKRKS
ncbi:PREDICTED: DNA repair protein UVH3 isoform X2 [Camelina sativa]|uniref:DNA repair protein UVH3 isoform X2 n=1 Tax=Camelina sativa TaxID=90675 RepID=A0ABM0YLF9_CAMSA|nr:PREDICTED: DNA repair protein UVH3 isoform X2 [Camelina sativa]